MQVAQTILEQLGGNRFIAMTGARQIVAGPDFLQFGIGRGAREGINRVRVTLNCNDFYDVAFYKIRGVDVREVALVENVDGLGLRHVFTEQTGFDTRL
ncbi:MAG TPA: hypothetical protein VNT52_00895 [Acidimicrobiales bacterium]|nr:hypothetical protein [Acidimicrobiales bacterium]